MSDRIEPALTAEEWDERGGNTVNGYLDWDIGIVDVNSHYAPDRSRFIPGLIALANAALPDNDPRKIKREWVEFLREQSWGSDASDYRGADSGIFRAIADALESYLPPER